MTTRYVSELINGDWYVYDRIEQKPVAGPFPSNDVAMNECYWFNKSEN